MKKIIPCLFVFFTISSQAQVPCVDGFADIYPCQHMDLAAYMPLAEIGEGANTNDVWGWVSPATQKEYALVGVSNGTAFVDVSDPVNPVYLGLLPTHTTNNLWRDLEAFNNYCFIGSEAAGHGLQIFDLLQLDNVTNPPITFENTAHYDGFGNSHTINIDPVSGYLYAMGTQTFSGGLHIVDINDPLNPTLAGGFAEDGYTHDGFAITYPGPDADWFGKEIVMACNADALTIVDVDDKSDCQYISTLNYPNLGYVHQGWFTKDYKYFLLNDELDEQDLMQLTRTHIFDVQDLDNPVYMGFHEFETTSIDHNLYVLDQFVYESNYRSGVRVLDASRTFNTELKEIGYFDLFPTNDLPLFSGTWSNYPYLPSGINLATSMYDGFFIIQPRLVDIPEVATFCDGGSFDITINADLYFPLTVSAAGSDPSANATGPEIIGPGTYTINLTGNWVDEGAKLLLTTNFGSTYEFPIYIDNCISTEERAISALELFPNPTDELLRIEGLKRNEMLKIYNSAGALMLTRQAPSEAIVIDVQNFPAGVYILKTESKSARLVVE
jgi:choice-of-anchor B domain-containing protein